MTAAPGVARRRLFVTGVVQGVGFRPFVRLLADRLGVCGLVGNDATGVFVEIEGPPAVLDEFTRSLLSERPPLASVESISVSSLEVTGTAGFCIVESSGGRGARTLVPPDVAVCDDCMAEVLNPADRRFRYPFANCTNCGPRFTIIRDLPYDRASTTMAGFAMCAACRAEYADPSDRRFHAQPIACAACGPQLGFRAGDRSVVGTEDALVAAMTALAAGQVVAVKGVGGYHLACDASSDAAVQMLRERKGRADKPFALMVADLVSARCITHVDDAEAAALGSRARPIVLLQRRSGASVSAHVAPGSPLVGLMLPYTPMHHLLFRAVPGVDAPVPAALVLTSGNLADEPICIDDAEAAIRLAGVADAFLVHDRPIHVPCDDSVVRIVDRREQPVRRSRGFAPLPVMLPVELVPTLAVGGELKSTCCLASGRHAWVSQHIGDMENLETVAALERSAEGFRRMYGIEPEVLAADAHPGYLSRAWAVEHAAGRPVVLVQHHHAHVAALMAEHGLDGASPVMGFAFDGTGYGIGDDGLPEMWGGEVLVADYSGFERVSHLRALPLPGGDAAVRNPCRIAVAYLAALGIDGGDQVPAVRACTDVELGVVRRQVARDVGCVPTTSMGRLFDVVASLLGVRHRVSYEAQAAIELEALAASAVDDRASRWAFAIDDALLIDPAPVVTGLMTAFADGDAVPDLALQFHRAVAGLVVDVAGRLRAASGAMPVALTGGVFQNALLARLARVGLEAEGFEVLTHRLVPPNDGGLSLGQAVVAGFGRR